ncbi:class I SAM-dependent methyltransferase [Vineibacter terrae]|uniref:Class I SAM-dependent methyltransferase n=1 Tax=Vineibacter terrae TaxID=2586908 RepID=A0A5C8PNP3_9HYPH|nr:class I SAM-dependent methyltransferase [Vineibacter terrae]TXL75675.1 class I SAM-dependent methyltransferase [Vineibacter terrae]
MDIFRRKQQVPAVAGPAEAHAKTFGVSAVPRVEIAPADQMFDTLDHYLRVGAAAASAIQSFTRPWDVTNIRQILDFGCGHGRVLRWLRAIYPEATIVGADITEDGVKFCAETFGSVPLISSTNIDEIKPGRTFNLIFAGSVITHLDEPKSRALLDRFLSWLNPGGLMVFSSHGATAVRYQESGQIDYMFGEGTAQPAIDAYRKHGFGYLDYAATSGYGVSFINPTWFAEFAAANAAISMFGVIEFGWDFHHDIIALRRA